MVEGDYMKENDIEVCDVDQIHPEVVKTLKSKMLPQETFNMLGNLYSVFSDPMRIKIIYLLFENEMCVCDISGILGASQSNVSHHLAILKANNLVSYRKEGKHVLYSLKDAHVKDIFQKGLEHVNEK
jgi:ArsR family transcriptional regulator